MRARVILTRPLRDPTARQYGKHVEGSVEGSDEGSGEPTSRPKSAHYVDQKTARENHPLFPPSKGGKKKGGSDLVTGLPRKKENEDVDLLATLKREAERLTKSERKELLDHLASLQLGNSESSRDLDMWAAAAQTALRSAIGAGGAGMAGPLAIKRTFAARSAWAPVESFAERVGITQMKVAERSSAYQLLARLLVERTQGVCRAIGAPLTAKMTANNTGDLAAIFDAAFPGYLEAGLAKLVFRRLVSEGLQEI